MIDELMKESVKEMEIGNYVDTNMKSQDSEARRKLFKGRKKNKKVKQPKPSDSDEPAEKPESQQS